MDKAFIEEFLTNFDDSRFPSGFLEDYELMECLSNNQMGETLLVKNRQTSEHFVAKCYSDKTLLSHITESDLLKKLHNDWLPAFIAEYQNDEMLCVVREYVDGTPLDQYAVENGLTQEQVISIGVQLCDAISCLHEQTPPIIHRDIKPQNIVMDKGGNPRLIDFGSSRVYDETAQEDTVCFGTKHFAAPEQYGYSQTDCRTDIFSLGVLLGWLLTGETDMKTAVPKIKNKQVRRIINKCTAFAPEKRYASAAKVKKALLLADEHKQINKLRWLSGLLTSIAILCLGFAIGRYTNFTPAFLPPSKVRFEEPLIEQAVRLALNKQDSELITKKDLLSVTELYIYGDQAASSYIEFEAIGEHMVLNDGTVRNGGISSLNDVAMLKNLTRVNIALQNISDLSPLRELDELEQVLLKHNPIEDITPLAGLPSLRELFLYDTRVSDLSALSGCPMLENIDVGKTHVTSMAAFAGIRNLTKLYAQQTPLETLSGIEEFARLQQIGISNVADGDLSPLLALPNLKEVHVDESFRDAAEAALKHAHFQIIFQ